MAVALAVSGCSGNGGEETATGDGLPSPSAGTGDDVTSTSDRTIDKETTTTPEAPPESTDSSNSETTSPDDEVTCSASGIERPGPQPELPDAVAETRAAILTAALACDIEGLAALTAPSFTASFGGCEPVEIWTAGEEDFDDEPLRVLVELLRLRPTMGSDGAGGNEYLWPPAFGYDTWEDVPEADRDPLRVLYDDDAFEQFSDFGGYIGYRIGITEDGAWTVFVAGD